MDNYELQYLHEVMRWLRHEGGIYEPIDFEELYADWETRIQKGLPSALDTTYAYNLRTFSVPLWRRVYVPYVRRSAQMLKPGERVALRSGKTVVVTKNDRGRTDAVTECECAPVMLNRLEMYPQVMVSAEGASWAMES